MLLLLLLSLLCAACGKGNAQPEPTTRITVFSPSPAPEPAPRSAAGEESGDDPAEERVFVLNVSSGKFHLPECRAAAQMKESNRREIKTSYQEMIAQGYKPCELCCQRDLPFDAPAPQ